MKVHVGDKHYHCLGCRKSSAYNRNHSGHKNVHTKDELFTCSECSIIYRNVNTVGEHIKFHTAEKLSCEQTSNYLEVANSAVHSIFELDNPLELKTIPEATIKAEKQEDFVFVEEEF